MAYIEGFLVPVPNSRKDEYLDMARKSAPMFKDCGATRIVECWGDDLMNGEHTDFYGAVKAEEGENVVFSWIEYPDKQTRDEAYKKMEEHPDAQMMGDMPFDGKRIIFSGFAPIFDTAGELA